MKCDCGLTGDESDHAQMHAEYLSGPEIPAVRLLSPCATDGPLPIYMVDRACPEAIRRDLAYVAMVAYRHMPSFPPGYDGTVTEDDQRLYLAADGAHIVAMVLTTLEDPFWHFAWQADGSPTWMELVPSRRRGPAIARMWTSAAYRRRGLALQLIHTASRLLSCDIAHLGWELPFTSDGARLVKRLCPEVFWGCGDRHSLRRPLKATPARCGDKQRKG